MDANQITTIVFLLSIIGSFSTVIVGLMPVEYAPIVIAVFGVLSEIAAFLKGKAPTPVDEPQ